MLQKCKDGLNSYKAPREAAVTLGKNHKLFPSKTHTHTHTPKKRPSGPEFLFASSRSSRSSTLRAKRPSKISALPSSSPVP